MWEFITNSQSFRTTLSTTPSLSTSLCLSFKNQNNGQTFCLQWRFLDWKDRHGVLMQTNPCQIFDVSDPLICLQLSLPFSLGLACLHLHCLPCSDIFSCVFPAPPWMLWTLRISGETIAFYFPTPILVSTCFCLCNLERPHPLHFITITCRSPSYVLIA